MIKSFRYLLFLGSLIIFVLTLYYAIPLIINTNKINQEIAEQITPSDFNPLQILKKGEHPSPTPRPTPIGGESFSVVRLSGTGQKFCEENQKYLSEQMLGFSNLLISSVSSLSAITNGAKDYYLRQSTASGKFINGFDNIISDNITKQRALISSIQNMQIDEVNFNCDNNNPLAQANLFVNDASQSINNLKIYNLSVKNLLQKILASNIEPKSTESAKLQKN